MKTYGYSSADSNMDAEKGGRWGKETPKMTKRGGKHRYGRKGGKKR